MSHGSSLRLSVWAVGASLLVACNAILGNQRVPMQSSPNGMPGAPDSRPHPLAAVAASAAGHETVTSGAAAPALEAGVDDTAVTDQAGAEAVAGTGGASGSAGMPGAGAAAGSGGAGAASADDTVHGRVLDRYHHPVADAEVRIGQRVARSDADGTFSFSRVAAHYDLVLSKIVPSVSASQSVREIWQYQGLSRRDPTLNCYAGAAYHSSALQLHVAASGFPQSGGRALVAAFGSPEVTASWPITEREPAAKSVTWSGAAPETRGAVHAMLMMLGTANLVTGYLSHQVQAAVLSASPFDVTLTLPTAALTTYSVAGHVSGPGERARREQVWLQFADGTSLGVLDVTTESADFSYLLPSVSDATGILVALEGDGLNPPWAAAAIDRLSAAAADVQLQIPATPVQLAPADAATGIDASTVFSWMSTAKVSALAVSDRTTGDAWYVVTAASQATLPAAAVSGYVLPSDRPLSWYVYAHDAESVDDAASEEHAVLSPHWVRGHYAASAWHKLTTAP